jgi:hypothetical protein
MRRRLEGKKWCALGWGQSRQELVLSAGAGRSGAPGISPRPPSFPSPPRTVLDRMHGRDWADAAEVARVALDLRVRRCVDADSRERRPHPRRSSRPTRRPGRGVGASKACTHNVACAASRSPSVAWRPRGRHSRTMTFGRTQRTACTERAREAAAACAAGESAGDCCDLT